MWEPQAVSTEATYFGFAMSLMSKIFMPSQDSLTEAGCVVLAHESSLREESVERKRRSPETEMSFWEPGQRTWATVFGLFGSLVDTCGSLAAANPDAKTPCRDHYTVDGVDTKARAARKIKNHISRAVAAVREAAPNADVYVVGYPQLMPEGAHTCPEVGFAPGDVAWGDHVEHLLNRSLRLGATAEGARYVDTQGFTAGHDACAGADAWINGSLLVFTGPKAST